MLSRTAGVRYTREPDNEKLSAPAMWAKSDVGRFPVLHPGDRAPRYARLWEAILAEEVAASRWTRLADRLFEGAGRDELEEAVATHTLSRRLRLAAALGRPRGGQPSNERVMVKSVHTPLALEWIFVRFKPVIVVVQRHPLNILASWQQMELPDRDRALDAHPAIPGRYLQRWGVEPPAPDASRLQRTVWQLGVFLCAMQEAVDRNGWLTVSHEQLSVEQVDGFRTLANRLALDWTPAADRHVRESNRPGSGYRTQRVGLQQPERWRTRLSVEQVEEAARTLEHFPLKAWPHSAMDPTTS